MPNQQRFSSRGSEWGRWDLHIHTPDSKLGASFTNVTWDSYVDELEKATIDHKIVAIGVTDYMSVDGFEKLLKIQNNANDSRLKSIFLIPNIEFRCLPQTKQGQALNIHLLIDITKEEQIEKVKKSLRNLKMKYKGQHYGCIRDELIDFAKEQEPTLQDDEAAYKYGIEQFKPSHAEIFEWLDNDAWLKSKSLVGISNGKDGISGLPLDGFGGVRDNILSKMDFIFSGNPSDRIHYLGLKDGHPPEEIKRQYKTLKPCLHGSDAHSIDKLFKPDEQRYCWIKADTTFEGLKHVVYEPEDRVFIGITPPVLEKISNNKTKYIKSLEIDQKPGYDEKHGVWFKNISIDFNKELVAIIGNKGSGKSALSDILGLLGTTHNAGEDHKNMSFLCGENKKLRFRKKGYAENFEAWLTWESNDSNKKFLNENLDTSEKEKVKYLPQHYFESLTNDLTSRDFENTIESIIFLHIPEAERLEKATFKDLVNEKKRNIEQSLSDLKNEIHEISSKIIALEKKKHPDYKKQIKSSKDEKQKEFDENEKNIPISKAPTNENLLNEANKNHSQRLQDLNSQLTICVENIKTHQEDLNKFTIEIEELSQLTKSLSRLEKQVSDYTENNRIVLERYSLNPKEIIQLKIDPTTLQSVIKLKEEKILELSRYLRTKDEVETDIMFGDCNKEDAKISLLWQQDLLQEEIEKIKSELSKPERELQEYTENVRKWQIRKEAIDGTAHTPNTLKFFQEEENFIDKILPEELLEKKELRIQKSLEIFRKKKEIVELYSTFKKSIDGEITKDKAFVEKFKMEIDVNFGLHSEFLNNFLKFIHKSKRGTFYNAEEKTVRDIFVDKDLLKEEEIRKILENVMYCLDNDTRENKNTPNEILDQIVNIQEFYDFFFSLDYMDPLYELKLDNKTLSQLSPGEKGALLLVFYLMADKDDIPLIIDQPEDNLDNKSVFQILTHFIQLAKKQRQIIIVTHNPNLAVGANAEQIIYVEIDKKNKNKFSYESGSIENPNINKRIVEILEGTMPAFDKRKLKYTADLLYKVS